MTRPGWRVAAIAAGWTAVAAVAAGQRYFFQIAVERPIPLLDALGPALLSCWLWAAFTPAILALSRRYRIERRNAWRRLGLHLALGLAFAALDAVLDPAITRALRLGPPHGLADAFLGNLLMNLVSYFALVAIGHAVQYHGLYVERELAAARLHTQLLGAQIRALEMQLRPHFLFNTLHTVASLVRAERNPEAVRTIAGLSDLLRAALREGAPPEVPLREELAFVERYLAIEQIRFHDRLETRVTAAPEALDALVPPLILQPLVENAIRHGIERRAAPGRVDVAVARQNGTLVLRVEDSSTPPSAGRDPAPGTGIGLHNTQSRLRHLYGDRQRLELTGTGGGAVALIELPFHREPMPHGTSPRAGR